MHSGIPEQAARVTSNRTNREVAQRGHFDVDRRVQFACRVRVRSVEESVRGPKPVLHAYEFVGVR